jgi:hypothetical protein
LPKEDLKLFSSGHIQSKGWLIQYCLGKNENGTYLDYYAAHRMTDDSHVRIYSDGTLKNLPSLSSWLKLSDNPTDAKKLKSEHDKHNQEVVEMLNKKGFNKFTINMFLSAGMDKE